MNIKTNLPRHVAIIPDGNRRWAKQKGLMPWQGHLAGAKVFEKLAKTALDLGIYCLSFWGGSWDNLTKRPKREISFLFKIYTEFTRKLLKNKEIHKNQVRVNFIGRWKEICPKKTIQIFEQAIEATKNHNQYLLNFLIAYNGTDEMLEAIKEITKETRENKNLKITSELLKKHLWTHQLPPVDLLIRTGSKNDPHNSNGFMMWLTTDSQLFFAPEFFPDFKEEQFKKAIEEYQRRERRRGR